MNSYPKEAPQENDPQSESVASRRDFLRGALATVAAITIGSEVHAEGKEDKKEDRRPGAKPAVLRSRKKYSVKPYMSLHSRFEGDLDAGSPAFGHPLATALSELPNFYYDHDVKNKTVDKNDLNIPTPSTVFELSKHVWLKAKEQVVSAKNRTISLGALEKAAQPGLPKQKRLQSIHDVNEPLIGELKPKWGAIEKDAKALMKKVQALVSKEKAAAKAMKTPSQAQVMVKNVRKLVPTELKAKNLANQHARQFDDYKDIESWLIPNPYHCDDISKDPSKPSNIIGIELIKALKEYINWHVEAATQRKERYHAIQSYVKLTGSKTSSLLKHDGTRYNDPILKGWLALVQGKSGDKKSLSPVDELMDKIHAITELQSKRGAQIHRCTNNATAEDINKKAKKQEDKKEDKK